MGPGNITGNRHNTLQQEMESCPHGNLCAALRIATKTTDDDRCCKENLFLGCIHYVSCSAGACVEHSHETLSDQIDNIAPFKKWAYLDHPLFKDWEGREGGRRDAYLMWTFATQELRPCRNFDIDIFYDYLFKLVIDSYVISNFHWVKFGPVNHFLNQTSIYQRLYPFIQRLSVPSRGCTGS